MTGSGKGRATEILLLVRDLPSDERGSILDESCADDPALRAQVDALLANEQTTRELRASEKATIARSVGADPSHIGAYRILQRLGEGGMGIVYLAEQEQPVRRRVALKLIKLGMDTEHVLARFEAERQALALMSHANIARVFDAGATEEGRPYFVMEYVPGVPITDYCDTQRLALRDRLTLFIQVCQAIHHAHQKAVIHRDIKPANILATVENGQPVPKVIDFGVAKAMNQRLTERTIFTEHGLVLGTPEYMSPEQAEMSALEVDTRTDIYSLGCVLFELMTGTLPFSSEILRKSGIDEMRRVIREQDPPRPSTRVTQSARLPEGVIRARRTTASALHRGLRGDLDWIILKALEKDRSRRYASVAEFASDIERHLAHQPVLAGPPGALYRLGKFVRRHRLGVGLAVVATLVVIGFAVTVTIQAGRIARERNRAERKAIAAQKVTEELTEIFSAVQPGRAAGGVIDLRELVNKAAERIVADDQGDPLVRVTLLESLAQVKEGVGDVDAAITLATEAVSLREASVGTDDIDYARSLSLLANLHMVIEDWPAAIELKTRVVSLYEDLYGPDDPRTATQLGALAFFMRAGGQPARALPLSRRVVSILEDAGPEVAGRLPLALHQYLNTRSAAALAGHMDQIPPEEEVALRRRVRDEALKTGGEDVPNMVLYTLHLGLALDRQGKLGEAEELIRQSLALSDRIFTDFPHQYRAYAHSQFAEFLGRAGRQEEALDQSLSAFEEHAAILGPREKTLANMRFMSRLAQPTGRAEEIRKLFSTWIERWQQDGNTGGNIAAARAVRNGL